MRDLFLSGHRRDHGHHVLQNGSDFEIGFRNLLPSRLDIGDVQKGLDQLIQPLLSSMIVPRKSLPFSSTRLYFNSISL